MTSFCANKGVVCLVSCTFTSEQNCHAKCEYHSKYVGIEDQFISSILDDNIKKTDTPYNIIQHFSESGKNSLTSSLASFPLMNRSCQLVS